MRAIFLLFVLAILALFCAGARSEDDDRVPARVLCDGGRLAAIQFYVPEPGLFTLRIPSNVCGREA